jgi:GntR family transcriptional regulator
VFLPVDPSSGLPVYRQIMDQVRRTIASGRLAPGERLPSIRELAATLQINPLTVGKAYGELERGGFIEMRRGLGMYVLAPRPAGVRALDGGVPPGVTEAARRLVLEAAQAGLTRAQTARAVDDCWRELDTEPAREPRQARSEARRGR